MALIRYRQLRLAEDLIKEKDKYVKEFCAAVGNGLECNRIAIAMFGMQ